MPGWKFLRIQVPTHQGSLCVHVPILGNPRKRNLVEANLSLHTFYFPSFFTTHTYQQYIFFAFSWSHDITHPCYYQLNPTNHEPSSSCVYLVHRNHKWIIIEMSINSSGIPGNGTYLDFRRWIIKTVRRGVGPWNCTHPWPTLRCFALLGERWGLNF